MSDIATISLRLDTADLERGNQELNKFQSVAEKASKASTGLNDNFKVGAEIREKHIKSLKDDTDGVSKEAESFQNLIKKISPATAALNKLDETQRRLNRLWRDGSVPDDDYKNYQEILASTEVRLGRFAQAETEAGKAALINADKLSRARNDFAKKLHEQVFLYGASKSQMLEYKAAQLGVSKEMTPLITQIKRQEEAERRATEQKKAAEIASRGLKRALAEQAQEERAATTAAERAHRERQAFLAKLRDEVATQNMSRQELLKYRAAQLNVSSAADIYIKKLSKAGNATHDFSLKTSAARKELGVMVGELARGNFGALRGSGITLANRSGLIDQLFSLRGLAIAGPIGAASVALYGLYKAYDVAEKESSAFNKAVILTGSYSGVTARQLASMASEVGKSNSTVGEASEVLSKLAGAGVSSSVNLKAATQSIIEFSRYSGQSINDLVKQFSQLSDDPAGGSLALTKNMHYLTAAQYQHIAALQKEGDKVSAVAAATDALNGAIKRRADEIRTNMGTLPKFFDEIERSASKMWDGIMGLGRDPSDAEKRAELALKIRSAENDPRRYNGKGKGLSYISNDTLAQWKKELAAIDEQAKKKQNIAKLDQDAIDAQLTLTKLTEAGVTAAEKRVKATKDLNEAIKDNAKAAAEGRAKLFSKEEIDKARAGIESLYKDPATPKVKSYRPDAGVRTEDAANRQLLTLQAQYKVLQDHKSINDVISSQRRQLWEEQAKFSVIEDAANKRKLTNDEKSLLLSKDAILAEKEKLANIGDQIEKQKQLNSMRDTAAKFIDQQEAATNSILSSAGVSDREGQRNREREQLKLSSKNPDFDKMQAAQDDRYKKEDELRGNWELGFKKGFAEYQDAATNVYGNVANIAQNAFTGMGNSFSDFLTTGKANFKDFATSILKQITQMITQMLVFKAIEAGASAFGFSLPGMASGGYTGQGGKFEPRGIVHGGEFVFTKEATSRIGVGNLYSMMHSAQGYANGGYVGSAQAPISQALQPAPRYGLVPTAGGVTVQTNVYIDGGSQQKGSDAASIDMSGITKQINGAIDKAITVQLTKTGSPLWNATYGRR